MSLYLKLATSVTLASMCILRLMVASEAMATSEAMVASEVRYELLFEISNISYPVMYLHNASFASLAASGGLGGQM